MTTPDAYSRQLAVVARLGVEATPDYVAERPSYLFGFVERVLSEEGVTLSDFRELDERPGQYPGGYAGLHGEWHFRLRQWRNSGSADFNIFGRG